LFAKPFLKAFDDHSDGISSLAKNQNSLIDMISGSADGEVIVWNLHSKEHTHKL